MEKRIGMHPQKPHATSCCRFKDGIFKLSVRACRACNLPGAGNSINELNSCLSPAAVTQNLGCYAAGCGMYR